MRYIIHGAGAIGSLVGGHLAESGKDVVLIGRAAHVDAINERGLLIKSSKGDKHVREHLSAVTEPGQIKPQPDDAILLAVKSAQTHDSIHQLHEVFPESTPVVCLQNGIRNEETVAQRFLHVYGAMVDISGTLHSPGVVAATRGKLFSLGNYPLGYDEKCEAIADDLQAAGYQVVMSEHVMAVKWSKLLLNLNNATLAIIDRHVQAAFVTPDIAQFIADVIEEGLHVLASAGISLEDETNPLDVRQLVATLRALPYDAEQIGAANNIPYELRTYPSTWCDIKNKRGETEAGYFNGEIILLGKKHHVPTPYNSTLLNIVEKMADEGDEPGKYSLEELIGMVEKQRLSLYES